MIVQLEPTLLAEDLDPLSWLTKPPDLLTAAGHHPVAQPELNHGSSGIAEKTDNATVVASVASIEDVDPLLQKPATSVSTTPPPPSAHPAAAPRSDDQNNHACKSAAPAAELELQATSTPNGTVSSKPQAISAPKAQQDIDNLNGFSLYDALCDPYAKLEEELFGSDPSGVRNDRRLATPIDTTYGQPQGVFTAGNVDPSVPEVSVFALRSDSPIRVPSWRWERARYMLRLGVQVNRALNNDAQTSDAHRFQRLLSRCRVDRHFEMLRDAGPALYHAWLIWQQGDVPFRWELEARLLAREPYVVIAQKMSITVDTIVWFESLFFNVLDHLDRPGWIVNCAIGPRIHGSLRESDIGLLVKLLGYHGGPYVVDELVSAVVDGNRPGDREEANDFLRADLRRTLATKNMLAIRMISLDNPKNAIRVMRLYWLMKWHEQRQNSQTIAPINIQANLDALMERLPWRINGENSSNADISGLSGAPASVLHKVECDGV